MELKTFAFLIIWLIIFFFFFLGKTINLFGEGDGTPLQYSCLENPMEEGSW